jgi:hypothetical protein
MAPHSKGGQKTQKKNHQMLQKVEHPKNCLYVAILVLEFKKKL